MNQKLVKMMKAIESALKDDSCKEEAKDLIRFVYKDLVINSSNNSLAWKILREVGRSNPKTIRETRSCFNPSDTSNIIEAARILGIKIELPVDPPF